MNNVLVANLQWVKPEDGGRLSLPPGPQYSTIARFEGQKDSWDKEAWSLGIEYIEPPDATRSHRVRVRFLAEGPEELLQVNRTFELMEGRQLVAKGTMQAFA